MQDEITRDQIAALMTEAAAYGDIGQVSLCRLALARDAYIERLKRETAAGGPADDRFLALFVATERCENAWQECSRVIADAKAQG